MNLQLCLDFATQLADRAGRITLGYFTLAFAKDDVGIVERGKQQ